MVTMSASVRSHARIMVVVLASVPACGAPTLRTAAPECASSSEAVEGVASDFDFAGTWNVYLVGKAGSTLAVLHLQPFDSLDPRIQALPRDQRGTTSRLRLVGTWSGSVAALGAIEPDSPESVDPLRPGVRVDLYRPPPGPSWLISIGAEGNNVRAWQLDGYSF